MSTCQCHQDLFVGLDFGTSGARAHVIRGAPRFEVWLKTRFGFASKQMRQTFPAEGGKLEADFRQDYQDAAHLDWAGAWQK